MTYRPKSGRSGKNPRRKPPGAEKASALAIKPSPLLDSIIENIPHMIFVKNAAQLRFVLFNKAGEDLLGYPREQLIGKNDYDFFPKEQADFFTAKDRSVLDNKIRLDIPEETISTAAKGKRLLHTKKIPLCDGDGTPRFLLGISEDITDIKRTQTALKSAEEQLRQSQKMDAIERLAGGMAHEFNNILTGIVGLASLIKEDIGKGCANRSDADQIVSACRRASALIERLLVFGQRKPSNKAALDLGKLLKANKKILESVLGERVRLGMRLEPGTPPAHADHAQIEQVLINLCLNARNAIPDSGTVTLRTRKARLKTVLNSPFGSIHPGTYAVLEVADTGHGIAPENLPHVFEPFFTTKGAGEGSGLGLSIIYGIVKEHRGLIDLESSPGAGSRFTIYLPSSDMPLAETPAAAAQPTTVLRGAETILIADDEEIIRSILKRALSKQGYEVLVAANGEEALELFTANQNRVAAVILDVIMPKLNGIQVYEKLAPIKPGVKVMFMSGYATIQGTGMLRKLSVPSILKPFSADEISVALRKLIDG